MRERRLRPAQQRGQHLTRLIGIVVDRLLAEDHETRLFGFADGFEDLRDRQRFDFAVGLHEDAAVGAHGECGADLFLRLLRTDGDDHDLGRFAFFLQANRFLDADFVEGVQRHFDVGEIDAGLIRLHADLDVVVDDPFDGHENFHGS